MAAPDSIAQSTWVGDNTVPATGSMSGNSLDIKPKDLAAEGVRIVTSAISIPPFQSDSAARIP